jgi:hypothetical protein
VGRILEKEADIPPISIALTAQVANATKRRLIGKGAETINKACATIRNGVTQNTRRQKSTPGELVAIWLRKILPKDTWNKEIRQVARRNSRTQSWREAVRNLTKESWDKLWTAYLAAIPPGTVKTPAQLSTTSHRPMIHLGASKATSSLITQIRTEKIGLNAFLADRRVPDKTATCTCGWPRQTAKHILYFCPEFADRRTSLFEAAGTRDYSKMLATARGAKAAAVWLQSTGLLPQFSLGLQQ